MKSTALRLKPETLLAAGFGLLAIFALGSVWAASIEPLAPRDALIALLILAGLIVASVFPIHIRYHTKTSMTSVPLYMLAVLMPPLYAALAAGVGVLISEVLMRKQHGSLFSDIVTSTARWISIVLVGALIVHWPWVAEKFGGLTLLGAAIAMFIGDQATVALQISQMCGESPWHVLKVNVREAGITEGAQYLIGMLGALAALQEVWSLLLLAPPMIIAYQSFKSIKEMRASTREILEALADAVDLRDPYTGGHSRRVAEWSERILKEMNIFGTEADLIVRTARVHDIGKIGIADEILQKSGALTPDERNAMQLHSEQGGALLSRYPDFVQGFKIIQHHHERWDGRGYPKGLVRYEIPFGARVIAVADSLDAIISDRPYHSAVTLEQAAETLRAGRGTQWDPDVVDACLRSIERAQRMSGSQGTSLQEIQ